MTHKIKTNQPIKILGTSIENTIFACFVKREILPSPTVIVRNKWFFSAFIIVLAFISISLEHTRVPNQEIIIQFSDAHTSQTQTQETIALVKSELRQIEASNIKVEALANGILKITYYSEIEVSDIKKIFSKDSSSSLGFTSSNNTGPTQDLPSDRDSTTYQLEIFKIQDSTDFGDFTGALSESKSESTRSSSLTSYALINKGNTSNENTLEKIAYRIYAKIAIAIDHSSHKIPEVRAGPLA